MSSGLELRPLENVPMHERVYQELRRELMAGKIKPGGKLTSRGIAAMLGTSDMPVRSALARLVTEGGLVQRPNGTIIVPRATRGRFRDVMETRAFVEGRATALACATIDAEGIARARAHAVRLEAAARNGNVLEYLDENQKLKFSIYAHCGSETLLSFISLLWLQAGPMLRSLAGALEDITRINFHNDALLALDARDAEAASQAISRDILEGMAHLLTASQFTDDDAP